MIIRIFNFLINDKCYHVADYAAISGNFSHYILSAHPLCIGTNFFTIARIKIELDHNLLFIHKFIKIFLKNTLYIDQTLYICILMIVNKYLSAIFILY